MNRAGPRLARIACPLAELAELIEGVRYVLDRFDALPDARLRLARAIEAALPLAHQLLDAAKDDAEEALCEDWDAQDELEAPS
jgi:hypothetical protein